MNNKMNTNFPIRSSIALALGMATLLPVAATATDHSMKPMKSGQHEMMMDESGDRQAVDGKMKKQDHRAMKNQRAKMMAEMKVQDTELKAQVAKMNSASKDEKLDLMAGIITKLVEQRAARHEQMADGMMNPGMQMTGKSVSPQPMIKSTNEESQEVAKSPESKQK